MVRETCLKSRSNPAGGTTFFKTRRQNCPRSETSGKSKRSIFWWAEQVTQWWKSSWRVTWCSHYGWARCDGQFFSIYLFSALLIFRFWLNKMNFKKSEIIVLIAPSTRRTKTNNQQLFQGMDCDNLSDDKSKSSKCWNMSECWISTIS